jgi:predicted polyphosphate/ATP-dependent NAD kinase
LSFVGIIVNPDSGRDIRRVISQAVTVDNQQKLNVVARALLALTTMGVERMDIMPDRFSLGQQALSLLSNYPEVQAATRLIEMPTDWKAEDSLRAAEILRDTGARCILVLGGDGTVRMVAKGCGTVPLLPISTGTNNVVPRFVEGTVAGLAAAYVALHPELPLQTVCWQHKRLVIHVNGQAVDQALVDVMLVDAYFVGSKAIWDVSTMRQLFVSRAQPTSIGLSSVVGMVQPVEPTVPFGAAVTLHANGRQVRAPIVPGGFATVGIGDITRLEPGVPYLIQVERQSVLALDGEREVVLRRGDQAQITLELDGPWLVDIEKTLLRATSENTFVI